MRPIVRTRGAEDEGFTLIELTIAMMLTAIIVTVLFASFIAFYKNSAVASGRDDHSANAEILATYLDRDLASAGSVTLPQAAGGGGGGGNGNGNGNGGGGGPAPAPSTCGDGTPLLTLSWQHYDVPATPPANLLPTPTGNYKAEYSLVTDSENPAECMLERVYTDPTTSTTNDLVHGLSTAGFSASETDIGSTSDYCRSHEWLVANLVHYDASDPADLSPDYTYSGCIGVRTNAA